MIEPLVTNLLENPQMAELLQMIHFDKILALMKQHNITKEDLIKILKVVYELIRADTLAERALILTAAARENKNLLQQLNVLVRGKFINGNGMDVLMNMLRPHP